MKGGMIHLTDTQTEKIADAESHQYGIDALKLISMFMVVVLHIFGLGGLLEATQTGGGVQHQASWLMDIGAYCAVDTFAIITGYLMINRSFKASRIISLWIQVAFYALFFNLLSEMILPGELGLSNWIRSFIPVSGRLWWYFTAYFVLSFFIPFLNKMLNALTKRQMQVLIGVILVLFSIVGGFMPMDSFNLSGGYSMLWLASLYVFGAYVRKFDFLPRVKKRWFALTYVSCAFLGWFSRLLIGYASTRILGYAFGTGVLINYLSPLVVMMSLSLLLFFKRVRFSAKVNQLLAWMAPLSFAVYIIHLHRFVVKLFIIDKFIGLSSWPVYMMVGGVLAAALAIFLSCIVIEVLRVQLFKYTRMTKLIRKAGDWIDKKIKLDL